VAESGRVTRFALPMALHSTSASIAAGPDGRLWIGGARGALYAIDTQGRLSRYSLGPADEAALVAAGPDRRMWVSTVGGALIRVTMKGKPQRMHLDLRAPLRGPGEPGIEPAAMVAGPGHRMWMTLVDANEIVDVTPGGHLTQHSSRTLGRAGVPYAGYRRGGLASALGDHLWVTEPVQERVALVTTGPSCAVPAVIGQTEALARVALRAAGCRASFVHPGTLARRSLTVTSQSFKAGRVIGSRTEVRIRLGHAPIACRLPLDAQVVERTPGEVIARRALSTSYGYRGWDDLWIGCASGTGRVVTLVRGRDFENEEATISFRLAGTRVAILTEGQDHYSLAGVLAIRTRDLASAGGASVVWQLPFGNETWAKLDDLAMSAQGAVAWIVSSGSTTVSTDLVQSVRLWVAGTTTTLDTVPTETLASLGIDSTSVQWTNAGEPKSAPLASP
jgi:hypothetical protein